MPSANCPRCEEVFTGEKSGVAARLDQHMKEFHGVEMEDGKPRELVEE